MYIYNTKGHIRINLREWVIGICYGMLRQIIYEGIRFYIFWNIKDAVHNLLK